MSTTDEVRDGPMTNGAPTVGLMLATVANQDTGQIDTQRLLAAATQAEAAGFDGVYVGDHLAHPHPILESVVTLAAIAAVTERVSLGSCVLLFGLRDPVVLAKQLGTLASFAPGRLRLGVGVGGEYPPEFEIAGVPLAGRGKRMESVLLQVRALLARDFERQDVTIAPIAPQVPFLLAGWSKRALRRAAEHGDGWIGYLLAPESFARRRGALLEHRTSLKRAGAPFVTGMLLPVHVSDAGAESARGEAAAAWGRLTSAELPERLFVAGSPDEIAEQLYAYWRLGCTEFVLGPADQGDGYLEQVERLATDVLPLVRRFSTAAQLPVTQ